MGCGTFCGKVLRVRNEHGTGNSRKGAEDLQETVDGGWNAPGIRNRLVGLRSCRDTQDEEPNLGV